MTIYRNNHEEYDQYGNRSKRNVVSRFYKGKEFLREALPGSHRHPADYPYSFEDYWVWHDDLADKSNWGADYSDRYILWEGYGDRYREILKTVKGNQGGFNPEQTQKIVDAVYQGTKQATGLSMSCNQASGYPILVFWYKDKEVKDGEVSEPNVGEQSNQPSETK